MKKRQLSASMKVKTRPLFSLIENAGKKYLEQQGAEVDWGNDFGGKQYTVPETWIRMPRKPRRLSEEQREKLVSRMRKVRTAAQEKK